MNSTTGMRPPFARPMTLRASATPDATAESWTISPPTEAPTMWASVVLPLPAGPHSSSEGMCPDWTSAVSGFPGPIR